MKYPNDFSKLLLLIVNQWQINRNRKNMVITKGTKIGPENSDPSKKLVDLKNDGIGRGAIFRIKGKWPHEDIFDLMLFDTLDEHRSLGLIVVTGYKAGLQLIQLPNGCLYADTKMVSTKWLIDHWKEWIYPDCEVEDVYYIDHYVTPELIEFI